MVIMMTNKLLRSVGVLALASVAPEVRPITGEQSSEIPGCRYNLFRVVF